MPRREAATGLLAVSLDKTAREPLHVQLDRQLRRLILEGRLKRGARLPPSRTLARVLKCSRNTVITTFDQLKAEGFLTGNGGAGTFVTTQLDADLLLSPARQAAEPAVRREARLSKAGWALGKSKRMPSLPGRAFSLAGPDVDQFPTEAWARITASMWRRKPLHMMRGVDAAGYLPLREAIAAHLQGARDVTCNASQIVVTAGATQALDLMVRLLTDPGDHVWIEDPCFVTGVNVMAAAHATVVPVPVDERGIVVEEGIRRALHARLAMVTPSHQFPLGVVMALNRRLELLEWAEKNEAWILEDDYDSEFCYVGRPLPTLQSLDTGERVIYVGTFSKVLFESLRVGYLVLPPHLADRVVEARGNMEQSVPAPLQPILARFIEEGHFAAHVFRMRRIYAARREALITYGQKYLGGLVEFGGDQSGLHVVAWFLPALAKRMTEAQAVARAAEQGIVVSPLNHYYHGGRSLRPAIVLGFGSISEERIEHAMRALAIAFEVGTN